MGKLRVMSLWFGINNVSIVFGAIAESITDSSLLEPSRSLTIRPYY